MMTLFFLHPQDVIELFSSTPDPDCPGLSLLQQYQAQVSHTPFIVINMM